MTYYSYPEGDGAPDKNICTNQMGAPTSLWTPGRCGAWRTDPHTFGDSELLYMASRAHKIAPCEQSERKARTFGDFR